jgi:hypothetical protein
MRTYAVSHARCSLRELAPLNIAAPVQADERGPKRECDGYIVTGAMFSSDPPVIKRLAAAIITERHSWDDDTPLWSGPVPEPALGRGITFAPPLPAAHVRPVVMCECHLGGDG